MMTEEGKAKIRDLISTEFTIMKIGNGGDSTNPMAENLDIPLAENTTVNISTGQSSIDLKASFTGTDISGQSIKEMGIFNSSGLMLGRINFDSIGPFTASETIELILTIEVD